MPKMGDPKGKKGENKESVKRTCNFFNFVYTTQHTDMFIKTNLNQRNS
jgi:hypothetical protein